MNNVDFKENNTKKELLDIISRLKKSEIISMINEYNKNVSLNNTSNTNTNTNTNNTNTKINAQKNTIKVPKNLGKIQFNNKRGQDNKQYKGV